MKRMAIYSVLFSVLAMGAMLYFLSVKTIIIADELTTSTIGNKVVLDDKNQELEELFFSKNDMSGIYLNIPLSEEIRPDNITIENSIVEQCINVFIDGLPKGFYKEFDLSGNYEQVVEGQYSYESGVTRIKLQLNGIYEQEYKFENSVLKLHFVEPRELYDKIVILDTENAEEFYDDRTARNVADVITSDIIAKLRERLKENNIKVYGTSADGIKPTLEQRLKVVNQSGADMAVSIYVNSDFTNHEIYGTEVIFNKDYFISGLGSVQLADILERELVTYVLGKANGLKETPIESSIIRDAKVPAAQVLVGYITNKREMGLLMEEEYRTMLAEGIYRGIIKSFQEIDKEKGVVK